MKNIVDLHCHTYYSDGRASPREMIEHAAKIGLQVLSITDHDNGRGSREAAAAAKASGIELIPAIEFTSRWDAYPGKGNDTVLSPDIDVLGYFLDLGDAELEVYEAAAMEDLHDRISQCAQILTTQGFPISLKDALRENPRYAGAMQLIDSLVKKGNVSGWDEGVRLFEEAWMGVRHGRFGISEIIGIIHKAGGAVVLAHPAVVQTSNGWLSVDHIASLVDFGLDGLEIYHHRLKPEARQHFLGLAQRFDMAISGGSDEHGWPEGFPRLGNQPVTVEMVEALRGRAGIRGQKSEGRSQY